MFSPWRIFSRTDWGTVLIRCWWRWQSSRNRRRRYHRGWGYDLASSCSPRSCRAPETASTGVGLRTARSSDKSVPEDSGFEKELVLSCCQRDARGIVELQPLRVLSGAKSQWMWISLSILPTIGWVVVSCVMLMVALHDRHVDVATSQWKIQEEQHSCLQQGHSIACFDHYGTSWTSKCWMTDRKVRRLKLKGSSILWCS